MPFGDRGFFNPERLMAMKYFIILLSFLCVCGCAEGKLLGREGRLYYGIPFGQDTTELEARKDIAIKFNIVTPGMTKKAVLVKLGEPHAKTFNKNNQEIWYYKYVVSPGGEPIERVYVYFNDYSVVSP